MSSLTHLDGQGKAHMVDVTDKAPSVREATAAGEVLMRPETLALIQSDGLPKGDVLAVARVAGIMAAKRTPDLIPLCHPLPITQVSVDFAFDEPRSAIVIQARAKCTGVTGVEMEALTAVSMAALTIYDMCKAVDRGMRIEHIRLLRKSGGRSGEIVLEGQDEQKG
jgi:cyclic pyranopterin phosphate synthase